MAPGPAPPSTHPLSNYLLHSGLPSLIGEPWRQAPCSGRLELSPQPGALPGIPSPTKSDGHSSGEMADLRSEAENVQNEPDHLLPEGRGTFKDLTCTKEKLE